MHGGAVGSGGQRGNQNALKTGLHTAEMIAFKRLINAALRGGVSLMDGS